jgi:hypothetical protein
MPTGGELLAQTTLRTSPRLYFRERTPWRKGTVQLDAGPVVLAHLHGDLGSRGRVRVECRLDRAGQGVLVALPPERTPDEEDDPMIRELSATPKHRRVLIADARAENAVAIAAALRDAGAAQICAGEAEGWRPYFARKLLAELEVEILPLDVTDESSVRRWPAPIGWSGFSLSA